MDVYLSVCLDVKLCFQIATPIVSIFDVHETWHAYLCANTHKTVERIFEILIFKFMANV